MRKTQTRFRVGSHTDIPAASTTGRGGASVSPPTYGVDFVDRRLPTSSKVEATLDEPIPDGIKGEAGISWDQPRFAAGGTDGYGKHQAVSWGAASYSAVNTRGSSTTVEKPFTATYTSTAEKDKGGTEQLKLKVGSISGGATIEAHTGGSKNAITNPPTTQAEAAEAVTDMKEYYKLGRGSWHTEAATKAHEVYHYREWKESCNHYWPQCRAAIEKLSAPNDKTGEAAIRASADTLVDGFKAKSRAYWMTLGDEPGDRPYAAGQLTLNTAIKSVQTLADTKKWTVPQGVDTPSMADPTYQPWLPYNP